MAVSTQDDELSSVVRALGLDQQNKGTIGRLKAHGGLAHATEGSDGRMKSTVRITLDTLAWEPSITVMPRSGIIDLELINDDENTHCALLPSNGNRQFLWLPIHSRGRATLELDGPGYYWFTSPIGNDEGSGLVGIIVVMGDVPEHARLDRPPQPRP